MPSPLHSVLDPTAAGALCKLALLLVTGVSVHVSLSPPNPPPPPKHLVAQRTLFERCVRWVTFCSKMMVWVEIVLDMLATTVLCFPSFPLASLISSILLPAYISPSHAHSLLTPSPLLALGALSTFLGSILRVACFRALGPFFTFELAIAPTHALVTTGPYARVRHPSYAGIYLTLIGGTAVGLARGAWLRECALGLGAGVGSCAAALLAQAGTLSNPSGQLAASIPPGIVTGCRSALTVGMLPRMALAWLVLGFWSAKVVYALRSTHRRLAAEDVALHRAFGQEWEDYAERVPWKLVPGIF
ncbi:uncharacterized protein FIBRA_03299 [Fibroporia radiculosa]|uniref:Protein-S-isoprenylcysteine O-methyltransferase n=1 Tax=Fibroporia radiculosa TaxID=599839 RepID=J4GNE5_9APHY|nr:uncharacterized protein FIBRA_03299 [Fibroporia radiculosa]CCM01250.1 predicted protein [Fibroporia radiculosa]